MNDCCVPCAFPLGRAPMSVIAKRLSTELLAEGFRADAQRLKLLIAVLIKEGLETIEDLDGLPDLDTLGGLAHLLPADSLFLEQLRERINDPVCVHGLVAILVSYPFCLQVHKKRMRDIARITASQVGRTFCHCLSWPHITCVCVGSPHRRCGASGGGANNRD